MVGNVIVVPDLPQKHVEDYTHAKDYTHMCTIITTVPLQTHCYVIAPIIDFSLN